MTLREWRSWLLEPNREPTATFLMATVGYKEGYASQQTAAFDFVEQTREAYYKENHIPGHQVSDCSIDLGTTDERVHERY